MRSLFKRSSLLIVIVALFSAAACSSSSSEEGDVTVDIQFDGQTEVTQCTTDDECVSDNVCMLGTCDNGTCAFTPTTGSCDDDNLCTENDQCNAEGECVGTEKSCDNGSFCDGLEVCNTATGECVAGTAPDLDDEIPCTVDECDEVNDEVVHAPDHTVCDDSNVCTEDLCDPAAGCTNTALTGDTCDDGDLCTTDDACSDAGECTGTAKVCSDDVFCNGIETCDSVTGECVDGEAPVTGEVNACTTVTCDEDNDEVVTVTDVTACDDNNSCTTDTCDEATGCVNTALADDEACDDGDACTDGDACLAGECVPGAWICAEICDNEVDDDGDGIVDCFDMDCLGDAACPTQNGDGCDSALPLFAAPLAVADAPHTVEILGSTVDMTDSFAGSCSSTSSMDSVYYFTLQDPMVFEATLTFGDSSSGSLVLLGANCQDAMEYGCDYGSPAELLVGLQAGTYYLVADGNGGDFVLATTFSAPAETETDCADGFDGDMDGAIDCMDSDCHASADCFGHICENPYPVNEGTAITTSDIGVSFVSELSTDGMGMNYAGTCDPVTAEAEDAVYMMVIGETVHVTITYDFISTYYWPALYLRSGDCEESSEIACASLPGSDAKVIDATLVPGTYYIFADANYPGDATDYEFTVEIGAVPTAEANCTNGIDDDQDGNIDCLDDDCTGIMYCADPYEENGAVPSAYDVGDITDTGFTAETGTSISPVGDKDYFMVTLTGTGNATVTATPSVDLDLYIAVLDGNGEILGAVDQTGTGEAEIGLFSYPEGGVYYLLVDGYGDEGTYDLVVEITPATETETVCDDFIDNDLDGLLDCEDDECAGDPACLGQTCASAIPINDGVALTAADDGAVFNITGDTIGAGFNYAGTCDPSGTGDAPELVYVVNVDESVSLTINYAYDDSWDWAALYVYQGDCLEENEIFCSDPSSGSLDAFIGLQPGTYYIVADGADAYSEGPFTLDITVAALPSTETDCFDGVDNDFDMFTDCADIDCAAELTCKGEACPVPGFLGTGTFGAAESGTPVQFLGDNTGSFNDYEWTCEGNVAVGLDEALKFELTIGMIANITLDFDDSYTYPMLFLVQGDCLAGNVLACDYTGYEGGPATIENMALEAGTYYLIVDNSYVTDVGPFTVNATFTEVTATETVCDDGVDNDADGFADCCDDDCGSEQICASESICDDGIDNDCDEAVDCADDDCAVANFCQGTSCAAAYTLNGGTAIALGDLPFTTTITGDTTDLDNTVSLECFKDETTSDLGDGPNQVYTFTITDPMTASISYDFDASTNYPAIFLTSGCDQADLLACDYTTSGGGPAIISGVELAAGTYYLVVDAAWSSDDGPYSFTFDLFNMESTETSCTDGIDNDGDTFIDCCDDECAADSACLAEVLCGDGEDNDCDTLVDCDDDDCINAYDCLGDTCELPKPLNNGNPITAADDGLTFDITGDTSNFAKDYELVCGEKSGLGADEVFKFVLADDMGLNIHYDFNSNIYHPAVFVASGACDALVVEGCDWNTSTTAGDMAVIEGLALSAGTYYIILDGTGSAEQNTYTAQFQFYALGSTETNCTDGIDNDGDTFTDCCDDECFTDAACLAETDCFDGVDNDCDSFMDCDDTDCAAEEACLGASCATAKEFNDGLAIDSSYDGQTLSATGDTSLQSNTFAGSCSTNSADAKDEVWVVEITEAVSLDITVDFVTDGLWPAFYVFAGVCDPAYEAVCAKTSTNAPIEILGAVIEPGVYYFVVDGNYASDAGEYTVDVVVTALAATETDCTDGLDNDGDTFIDCCDDDCVGDGACVEVCDDGLDNDCDAATDCCDTECSGDLYCAAETNCTDGEDNDCDDVADCLDSDCALDPECVGETCELAIPLNGGNSVSALDDGLVLNETGTTSGATKDYEFTCGAESGLGPDLVYMIEVTETVKADIVYDFVPTYYYPALFITKGNCDEASVVACDWSKGSSDDGIADVNGLIMEPGTYYFILDGTASGEANEFTLDITFSIVPTNETDCTDGMDNDGDTFIDCCDDDCSAEAGCLAELECGDGEDNDCDDAVDCDDTDCNASPFCVVNALPFSEDVEHDGAAPEGWVVIAPESCSWSITDAQAANGSTWSAWVHYSSSCSETEPVLLLSPLLDVSACNELSVSFYQYGNYTGDIYNHSVGITDGVSETYVTAGDPPEDAWAILDPALTFDVTGVDQIKVFFAYLGSNADDWYIDDVLFECTVPSGVTTETNCTDGIDNDADTFVDCADDDCALDAACDPTPQAGDIIITEVMQNPAQDGEAGEYVEFYNLAGKALDLEGCIIMDDGSDSHTIANAGSGLFIQSMDTLVMANNGVEAENGGFLPDYVYSGVIMSNSGDEVVLVCDGTEIARINYDNGTTFPDPTNASMQLDMDHYSAADYADAQYWCISLVPFGDGANMGTPNANNYYCDTTGAEADCTNGLDDDMDGLVDCCDPGCGPDAACAAESSCIDGFDNDCDGDIDCDDSDCYYDTTCFADADSDGVADAEDVCNRGDDAVDTDPADGLADACQIGFVGNVWPNGGSEIDSGNDVGVFLQVWMDGVTNFADVGLGLVATIKYKMEDDAEYVTAEMTYNAEQGNNDEFTYAIPSSFTEGGKALIVEFEVKYVSTDGIPTDYPYGGTITDQADPANTAPISYTITGGGNEPGTPVAGDVIFSEIMYDSSAVNDNNGEWFELYNTTGADLQLENCTVGDNDNGSPVTIDNGGAGMVIPANGYLVFGRDANTAANGGVTLDWVYVATPTTSSFQLGNSGDNLTLVCDGVTIDFVDYDLAGFADPVGKSLNLDSASMNATANDDGANWCATVTTFGAGDGGTPGAANESCQ